jgi:predicted cupin superfamily sugar epimerase
MLSAEEIIQKLELIPLPEEGGFYKETYRSIDNIDVSGIGDYESSKRKCYTSIFYLITPEEFSALHRVKSDELFHFYMGDPCEMIQIDTEGDLKKIILGNDLQNNERIQQIVPKNFWQGLRLLDQIEGGFENRNLFGWSLLGATVAPGFEFEDFEVQSRKELIDTFPSHEKEIIRYTRG